MRNSIQISELLRSADCELRIANCKWGPSCPTLNMHARAAFVYLNVVFAHRSTPSSQKKPWETIRTIVSQLSSTVSFGIDTVAFGGLTTLPFLSKGRDVAITAPSDRQATTRRVGLPVNRINRIIEKLSHLEGLISGASSIQTPSQLSSDLLTMWMYPLMVWLLALVPGTGGTKVIDAEQRDERTTTQTDGKATCCAPYQSHGQRLGRISLGPGHWQSPRIMPGRRF
jgi:hypothetical protein